MINLLTSFYTSKYKSDLDDERSKELIECLRRNVESQFIEKVHLFVDDNEAYEKLYSLDINLAKVNVITIGKKPTYTDYFLYILDNLREKICMITNSDIYLAECVDNLIVKLDDSKLMYALTRYEHDMSSWLVDNFCGSHDCYIFNAKFLDENIIGEHTKYTQNIPGIETHIIKVFIDNGYNVYNPCKQIKIVHLHKTALRKYDNTWIGLHRNGDFEQFYSSVWCIPPQIMDV